jgi:ribose transport system substrate-binding protein
MLARDFAEQVYVEQGILAASFEYPTGGKEAIDTALRILKGESVPQQVTLSSRIYQATP